MYNLNIYQLYCNKAKKRNLDKEKYIIAKSDNFMVLKTINNEIFLKEEKCLAENALN